MSVSKKCLKLDKKGSVYQTNYYTLHTANFTHQLLWFTNHNHFNRTLTVL